jgi:hypothetical protein
MSPAPDQPTPPKPTAQARRAQRQVRLHTIRLRLAILQELDARGITTPDNIGEALGMSAIEAHKLLTWQRRESNLATLEAAAARLGAQVPPSWRGRAHTAD